MQTGSIRATPLERLEGKDLPDRATGYQSDGAAWTGLTRGQAELCSNGGSQIDDVGFGQLGASLVGRSG